MLVKHILLYIALFIDLFRICALGSRFLDIVFSINKTDNNYNRFINLTRDHFSWLSLVLCDNETYSYEIIFDDRSGSLVSTSSKTFITAGNIDSSIHLKEFTCTNIGSSFGCTRKANNSAACIHNVTWIYLDVNLSSTCSNTCATLCPLYPIQDIFIKQTETVNNRNVQCQSPNNDQSTTGKSDSKNQSTSTSVLRPISSSSVLPEQSSVPKNTLTSTTSSTSTVSSSSANIKETSDDDSLPVIVGSSVGGGLCIIILLIVIGVCVTKFRQCYHSRKSVTSENTLKFKNDNALDTQLHHHNVCETNRKKDDSAVNKLEIEQRLSEKNNGIRSILDGNNVNSDNSTYFGIGKDIANNAVGDDYASELNESKHGFSQNTFSNIVFNGFDADYSCLNDNQDKNNNSGGNVDENATKQSSSHNSPENTYATLGEKIIFRDI